MKKGNLSPEYIELLSHLDKDNAAVGEIVQMHQEFWQSNMDRVRPEVTRSTRSAYHLASSPPNPSQQDWFLAPQVKLQRVALYSETVVFDDFLGNVIDKIPNLPEEASPQIEMDIRKSLKLLLALRRWVDNNIVKILPSNSLLAALCQPSTFQRLDELTLEELSGDLSDRLAQYLSKSDLDSLSFAAGHIINYRLNKAEVLAQEFDFAMSPDDKLFVCLGEKLNWNYKNISEKSSISMSELTCHYVLKSIQTRYLCDSSELAFQIRLDGRLHDVRKFFGERVTALCQSDPRIVFNKQRFNEFEKDLADEIKVAQDEMEQLKRKYGSEAIKDLSSAGLSLLLGVGINYLATYASWLPSLVSIIGLIPAGNLGTSAIKAINEYITEKKKIKAKPAFILGSMMEGHK